MSDPTKLFVYGTLKRGYGNHVLLDSSKFLGEAITIEPHTLVVSGLPYLLTPRDDLPGMRVKGELYSVTRYTLRQVDGLEGHPFAYRRGEIEVEANGVVHQAVTYFWPWSLSGDLDPIEEF